LTLGRFDPAINEHETRDDDAVGVRGAVRELLSTEIQFCKQKKEVLSTLRAGRMEQRLNKRDEKASSKENEQDVLRSAWTIFRVKMRCSREEYVEHECSEWSRAQMKIVKIQQTRKNLCISLQLLQQLHFAAYSFVSLQVSDIQLYQSEDADELMDGLFFKFSFDGGYLDSLEYRIGITTLSFPFLCPFLSFLLSSLTVSTYDTLKHTERGSQFIAASSPHCVHHISSLKQLLLFSCQSYDSWNQKELFALFNQKL
jgi:hypothetical protein